MLRLLLVLLDVGDGAVVDSDEGVKCKARKTSLVCLSFGFSSVN